MGNSICLETFYKTVPEMMQMSFHSCRCASIPEGRHNDEIDERVSKEIGSPSHYKVGACTQGTGSNAMYN